MQEFKTKQLRTLAEKERTKWEGTGAKPAPKGKAKAKGRK
jgi:hypothetical protein